MSLYLTTKYLGNLSNTEFRQLLPYIAIKMKEIIEQDKKELTELEAFLKRYKEFESEEE